MIKFIAFILFISSLKSFAQLDIKARAIVRSFPQGLALEGEVGHSLPFYKKDQKILFGYIRPAINFRSSVVVNTVFGKLDFNPISFVNFYYGISFSKRKHENFHTFDCSEITCSNNVKREHYGIKLALKYRGVFFLPSLVLTNASPRSDKVIGDSYQYVEELASLVHQGKKSRLKQYYNLLGFDLSSKLKIGYLGIYSEIKRTHQSSKMHLIFAKLDFKEDWDLTLGSGYFQTRAKANVATSIMIFTWTPKKGLPLF